MDESDRLKYILLSTGSLLVASSFTLVGFFSFRGDILAVILGYLIFVLGYKTCWYGVHQEGGFDSLLSLLEQTAVESKVALKEEPFNYLQIIGGVGLASYGSIEFVHLIEHPGSVQALLTGAAVFGGYVIAHEGVNEVPI